MYTASCSATSIDVPNLHTRSAQSSLHHSSGASGTMCSPCVQLIMEVLSNPCTCSASLSQMNAGVPRRRVVWISSRHVGLVMFVVVHTKNVGLQRRLV